MPDPVAAAERLAREDGGRVLAVLAHRYGDLDLAHEAVQEGLLEAVTTWPARGVPDNPAGWLMTVAHRKALDRLRREASARRRTLGAAPDLVETAYAAEDRGLLREGEGTVPDERLRLLLLCCHPALGRDAQIALTLRLVAGLTTAEIAAGLLEGEATVTQRIVRAKRKIRAAGIPLSLPERLDDRVDVLLGVVYLVFNEGYLARSGAPAPVRVDLADEAVRLARVVAGLAPGHAEAAGLLALLLFQHSRFATRTDGAGDLVLLADQDRSRWDGAAIAEADAALGRALALRRPGAYQVQALIAGQHATARTAEETDWSTIAGLYAQLVAMTGSPVVRLNHAVAVGMADGARAGLALLARVDGLDDYHLLHATRADLLARSGDDDGALVALRRARALTANAAEQRLLDRRIAALGGSRR